MGLDEQIQRTADELEIRNLLARLAHLADDGELDDYIRLFTQDAIWEGGAYGTRRGHAEILAGSRERRASDVSGPGSHTRHVITTTAIELDGDRATGTSTFHYYANTDAVPALLIVGVYRDEFRREPEGWKLAHRVIVGPPSRPARQA